MGFPLGLGHIMMLSSYDLAFGSLAFSSSTMSLAFRPAASQRRRISWSTSVSFRKNMPAWKMALVPYSFVSFLTVKAYQVKPRSHKRIKLSPLEPLWA